MNSIEFLSTTLPGCLRPLPRPCSHAPCLVLSPLTAYILVFSYAQIHALAAFRPLAGNLPPTHHPHHKQHPNCEAYTRRAHGVQVWSKSYITTEGGAQAKQESPRQVRRKLPGVSKGRWRCIASNPPARRLFWKKKTSSNPPCLPALTLGVLQECPGVRSDASSSEGRV